MPPAPHRLLRPLPVLWLLAVLAQGLLVLNPGYFSHDELQWGARADVAAWSDLPWVGWTEVDNFQWRPLTFNTWLPLSHALFDTPVAFHALWVAWGSALAAALAGLVMRLGLGVRVALVAGLGFALNPYAVYVHGWVATTADLIWVGCGLALAHGLLSLRERAAVPATAAALTFALTALGLLAKEAALALPALIGLLWVFHRQDRILRGALVGSAVVALAYLGLRLGALLARSGTDMYAFAPAAGPANALAYPLFLLQPSVFEVGSLWNASTARLAVALLLWTGLLVGIALRSPRQAVMLLAGSILVLAPALPLNMPANQYGYGFSAWIFACAALAWPTLTRGGRVLLGVMLLLSCWHGLNVQREIRAAGEKQAVFQPALVQALQSRPDGVVLASPAPDEWLYRRLTHDVHAWRGVPIGDRVTWAAPDAPADFAIRRDGSLQPMTR